MTESAKDGTSGGARMAVSAEADNSLTSLANHALEQGDVKYVLTMAHEQLSELLQQRAAIVKRIATLRRTVSGLVEIFGDEVLDARLRLLINTPAQTRKGGLTDACRSVLMSSCDPLASGEIVTRIRSTDNGLLRNQKNAVASVTTILRRLQSYGETAASTNPSGRRTWMWKR
jgi:hypothetical protein